MRIHWLTLTLFCFSGCFGSHGPGEDDDAGIDPPPFDGGGAVCLELEGSALSMVCPPTGIEGSFATVTIDSAPSQCCSSGAVSSRVFGGGGDWNVSMSWTACECCAGCRCVGPIQTFAVEVGPLVAGANVVDAGGTRCVIEGQPALECRGVGGTDFRAPRHLIEGQELSATLTSFDGLSCGCTPSVNVEGEYSFSMELCGCCDECDCIDGGYQSSVVLDPPSLGGHMVVIPHGVTDVVVHERATCSETPATSVSVVGPSSELIVTGPRLWWAQVRSEAWVCCAQPAPAVERIGAGGRAIELRALSCVQEDCLCDPPAPVPAEAWFSLGELSAGDYTLTVGALTTTFTVP